MVGSTSFESVTVLTLRSEPTIQDLVDANTKVTETTIDGKKAFMNRLYVATDESGVMPTVLYIDVFGEDMATGAALKEHIVKK